MLTPAERLIEEARTRGIGRDSDQVISLEVVLWAILMASEGGLDRYRGITAEDWHDCPTCGLQHRKGES